MKSASDKLRKASSRRRLLQSSWWYLFVLQCDLEGSMPNVTISLSLPTNGSPLQDILVHPCVTSLDSAILTSSSIDAMDDSAFSGPYKFPLTPPLESFNLCYYTSQVSNLGEVGTLLIFTSMNCIVRKSPYFWSKQNLFMSYLPEDSDCFPLISFFMTNLSDCWLGRVGEWRYKQSSRNCGHVSGISMASACCVLYVIENLEKENLDKQEEEKECITHLCKVPFWK